MLTQVWNDGARTSSNLCSFSFKSWRLAGAGLVAHGRHLMVPELSSGAPGAHRFSEKCIPDSLLDSGPGGSFGTLGGPIVSQVTLRSFLRSPATGGAENDPRVTWDTLGPPKVPKVEGEVFMVGPSGILFECVRDPGRRSRAMSIFALETNGNGRLGTLRFSLWKPSPSALCFFSFKRWYKYEWKYILYVYKSLPPQIASWPKVMVKRGRMG